MRCSTWRASIWSQSADLIDQFQLFLPTIFEADESLPRLFELAFQFRQAFVVLTAGGGFTFQDADLDAQAIDVAFAILNFSGSVAGRWRLASTRYLANSGICQATGGP